MYLSYRKGFWVSFLEKTVYLTPFYTLLFSILSTMEERRYVKNIIFFWHVSSAISRNTWIFHDSRESRKRGIAPMVENARASLSYERKLNSFRSYPNEMFLGMLAASAVGVADVFHRSEEQDPHFGPALLWIFGIANRLRTGWVAQVGEEGRYPSLAMLSLRRNSSTAGTRDPSRSKVSRDSSLQSDGEARENRLSGILGIR